MVQGRGMEYSVQSTSEAKRTGAHMKLRMTTLRGRHCSSIAFTYDSAEKAVDLVALDNSGRVSTVQGHHWRETRDVLSLSGLHRYSPGSIVKITTGGTGSCDPGDVDPTAILLGSPVVTWTPESSRPKEQYEAVDGGGAYYGTYGGVPRVHIVTKNGRIVTSWIQTRACFFEADVGQEFEAYRVASEARMGCT